MSITRPVTIGGVISVTDSASLATLDPFGLPTGTRVFNQEVGAMFVLTACARTEIELDPADGYVDDQWTFANADFAGADEGNTLLISLDSPNAGFSAAYVIDTVDDPTIVTVVDPPGGATTPALVGSVVMLANAPVTDVTVSVFGDIGSVWQLEDASGGGVSAAPISGDGTDEDPFTIEADSIPYTALESNDVLYTLASPGVNFDLTGLAGDTDGDYEMSGVLLLTGNAAANSCSLLPNNLDTNQIGASQYFANTSAASTPVAGLVISTPTSVADSTLYFTARLTSHSGVARIYESWAYNLEGSGQQLSFHTIAAWTGTATVITSLRIASVHGLRAGSFVRLRKLRNLA